MSQYKHNTIKQTIISDTKQTNYTTIITNYYKSKSTQFNKET